MNYSSGIIVSEQFELPWILHYIRWIAFGFLNAVGSFANETVNALHELHHAVEGGFAHGIDRMNIHPPDVPQTTTMSTRLKMVIHNIFHEACPLDVVLGLSHIKGSSPTIHPKS